MSDAWGGAFGVAWGNSFGALSQQVIVVNVGAGGEIDWREYVTAKAHEKTTLKAIAEKKKEIKQLAKKIKAVGKEVLPTGALSRPGEFMRLAMRKEAIKVEIWNLEEQLKGLRITLEAVFKQQVEDEDDEDLLLFL